MKRSLAYVVCALLALHAARAAAQVKPKILIIFDTSGSMLQNSSSQWQEGDGSLLCASKGQSSRIYQLKAALFDALQGMGAGEVDFALATFPMFMDPARTPLCAFGTTCQNQPSCSGHYFTNASLLSEITAYNRCLAPDLLGDCRYGCRISSHSATTQTNANCGDPSNPCAAWYPDLSKQVLWVPFSGSTPEKVMIFFDQREDGGSTAPLQNPEIRAGNGWYTPLGKSLFYAHGYFHKEVALPAGDPKKKCERLVVAMFTDGGETCNEDAANAFYPNTWATNLNKNLGAVVHTVGIDISPASTSTLQGIAAAGKGTYYGVAGNSTALKQAFLDIVAKSLPPTESCNGVDDDCDLLVDEDFPQKGKPCDNGKVGVCYRTGVYVCKSDGSGVMCNALDASGSTETCNLLDDDCDGLVDELPECQNACHPQPEICNNKDDDCDGAIDEDIPSVSCGKDLGVCKPGKTKCVAGKLICDGGTGPATEVCDGLDNDCDGYRDGMTESCYSFAQGCTLKPGGGYVCKGFCKDGLRTCSAKEESGIYRGVWSNCQGEVGPQKELCDGLDNDCDGEVDEQAECPGGAQCIEGQCTRSCTSGEFVCPKGQLCKNGWCVVDACDAASCAAQGGLCKNGTCIDPCKDVTCPKYEVCQRGACVDTSCYSPAHACKAGEVCTQGVCQADRCAQVTCGADAFCKAGECLPVCNEQSCAPGESCVVTQQNGVPAARCEANACAAVRCNDGFVCDGGRCVNDPCITVSCAHGQVCVLGSCVADPCEDVACPKGFACKMGACVQATIASTTQTLATGSGGAACAMATSAEAHAPWPLLLALCALVLRRRWRRAQRSPRTTTTSFGE